MPTCETTGCGATFAPGTRGSTKKYCSRRCGNKSRANLYTAAHPEWRASYALAWSRANGKKRHGYHLKHTYGLSAEDYDALLISQCGKCAICDGQFDDKNRPHVDHDHATGKVRSLLCPVCNAALSWVEDEEFRAKALAYLEARRG